MDLAYTHQLAQRSGVQFDVYSEQAPDAPQGLECCRLETRGASFYAIQDEKLLDTIAQCITSTCQVMGNEPGTKKAFYSHPRQSVDGVWLRDLFITHCFVDLGSLSTLGTVLAQPEKPV